MRNEVTDFFQCFKYWRYYLYSAYLDLDIRFKQTTLGLIWQPLNLIVGVFFIALVWFYVMKQESTFIYFYMYMLTGFAFWSYFLSLVGAASNFFNKYKSKISNEKRPMFFYVIEAFILKFVEWALLFPFLILASIFSGIGIHVSDVFLFMLLMVTISLTSIGFIIIIGVLVFIMEDARYIIRSIVRIMFFMTPIVWHVDRLGAYMHLILLNPLYSYLYIFRMVFLSEPFSLNILIINVVSSLLLFSYSVYLLGKYEQKIRYKCMSI